MVQILDVNWYVCIGRIYTSFELFIGKNDAADVYHTKTLAFDLRADL